MCGCNRNRASKKARITVSWPGHMDPATGKAPLTRNYLSQVEARTAMKLKPGGVKLTSG